MAQEDIKCRRPESKQMLFKTASYVNSLKELNDPSNLTKKQTFSLNGKGEDGESQKGKMKLCCSGF